ncbi:hypothetical protein AB0N09_21880 [Streptomyces erythrochromogenes]|uniref:hypothetical protein n=1 Tax=Streptomyces erythrochromogenes TaxID=285574 RepID=UPI003425191C
MADRTSAPRTPRTYPADPMMDEMLRRARALDASRKAPAVPASRPADSLMDEALRRVRAGR